MSDADRTAPSLEDFAQLAKAAFEALPEPFRGLAGEVLIRVDDFPSKEILADLGIEDPFELTGLYSGVNIAHRDAGGPTPEASWLFH
jgi:predicted Zn-dependent protease with MMP-like domain